MSLSEEMTPVEMPQVAEEMPSQEELPVPQEGTDPSPDPLEERAGQLAEEFLTLAGEIKTLGDPSDLPQEVWDAAAEGVPLRDAYLRYWFAEYTRRQEAVVAAQKAAAGSAGSLRDMPSDPRPEEAAFALSFQTAVD